MANTTKGATKKTVSNGVRTRQPEADAVPPPAYFLSLTVENFRCFGLEQTLDLSDGNGRPAQWTIILGNNGVGKTSLLQCLAGMQPIKDVELDGFIPLMARGPIAQQFGLLIAPVTPHNIPPIARFKLREEIYYGSTLRSSASGKILKAYSINKLNSGIVNFSVIAPKEQNIGGLVCYGYNASRRMGQASLAERKDTEPSAGLFSDDYILLNAEEWLLQADYAASRESSIQEQVARRRDQIKDILIELLPDVTDIKITEPEKTNLVPRVEVQTPYGWVHIQSLSLGYKTLIAWMVDLASRLFERYPHSKNPLAEPAVVLVDEIDLHLHPEWQRKLIGDLTRLFLNTQFIVTAHSPLVVQAASDANIVLLRREGDHVVIDNDVKAIEGWRVDQVLTSDLFGLESARPPQLDAALKERNKILGKGTLTKADKVRLKQLESEIGELPTGETPADLEAMDIIRRAAALLKNGQDGA